MATAEKRASRDADAIRSDGYVVLPELLSREETAEIKQSLEPWLRGELMGRNDFEGLHSERVYALLAKAPPVAKVIEHPSVLAIIDQLLETIQPTDDDGGRLPEVFGS